jgi:hypothetical protein
MARSQVATTGTATSTPMFSSEAPLRSGSPTAYLAEDLAGLDREGDVDDSAVRAVALGQLLGADDLGHRSTASQVRRCGKSATRSAAAPMPKAPRTTTVRRSDTQEAVP